MSSPLVSVCIALYECESYIIDTIQSVRAQTYTNWELVLTDDSRSSHSATAVARFLDEVGGDLRVRFYSNRTRLGMVENWNAAVAKAEGAYIKLMGQDDLISPGCLAEQVAVLEAHPGITLVTCARRIINASGSFVMLRSRFVTTGEYLGRDIIRRCLTSGSNVVGEPVSVLFRRSTLGTQNLFNPNIVYFTDLAFWIRLLRSGNLYYLGEPQCSFRIHSGAATRRLPGNVAADFVRILDSAARNGDASIRPLRRRWILTKVRIQSTLRQSVYRLTGALHSIGKRERPDSRRVNMI